MAKLARPRRGELEGFVEGLFRDNECLDLSERAHKALGTLTEIRAMLDGDQVLVEDPSKPAAPDDIAASDGHFRGLTRIAEHEMHEAVLSCARAQADAGGTPGAAFSVVLIKIVWHKIRPYNIRGASIWLFPFHLWRLWAARLPLGACWLASIRPSLQPRRACPPRPSRTWSAAMTRAPIRLRPSAGR
jgi:hypothetical protein